LNQKLLVLGVFRGCGSPILLGMKDRQILATASLEAAMKAGCADAMERACDEVEVSGARIRRLPDVRWKVRKMRRAIAGLEAAVNTGRADEMERACDEVEASGAKTHRLPEVRRQARRIRRVRAGLEAAVKASRADAMVRAHAKVGASGAGTPHLPNVRQQAQRIRRATAGLEAAVKARQPDAMERACDEVKASGADASFVPAVRQQAQRIRREMASLESLEAAVKAGCADEMERACDEVEASGADASRLPEVRQQARWIRVRASMEAYATLFSTAQAVATSMNADEIANLELVAAEARSLCNKLNLPPKLRKCIVCNTSMLRGQTALCSRGLHALCSSCFTAYAQAEQQQQESVMHERGARLLCPYRLPHDAECIGWFSEQTMAAFLPAKLFQIHMDQQREQIHVEESAKFTDMLNQMAMQLQQDMPGISCELLEKQLKGALPGTRQCGGCGYGPGALCI